MSSIIEAGTSAAQEYRWTLNFGPQHPATHTTLRLILTIEGERVINAVPDIGYLHSGFEKIGEHLNYNQYVTVTDRMNYISETLCGARFTNSYTRVGGLMYDATPKFVEQVRAFVKSFPRVHADICRLLNRNRIFVERTKGIGILSKEAAINRSATGPIARASGVTRDLRKDEPYLAYGDLDFNVICSTVGDCFHRYLVRMDEMLESLKIVEQALENLPAGPVNVPMADRMILPDKERVYNTIEGLITHFEVVMTNRGFHAPKEECYSAIEA